MSDPNTVIEERIARIEISIGHLTRTIEAIEHEIGGAPKIDLRHERPTLRDRVHNLENDKAAANAARAALSAAESVKRRSWSMWEKAGIFAIALASLITQFFHI